MHTVKKEGALGGQEKQALIVSLRLLAASPKSRKSLRQKLEAKGFDPEITDKTLDKIEKQGYLNDRVYAQALYQGLVLVRPSGRKRIAFELKRKGISEKLADEILDQYSASDERERALELAKVKQSRWCKLDKIKQRKKIYDLLVRRGFDFALSREVVQEIENSS